MRAPKDRLLARPYRNARRDSLIVQLEARLIDALKLVENDDWFDDSRFG